MRSFGLTITLYLLLGLDTLASQVQRKRATKLFHDQRAGQRAQHEREMNERLREAGIQIHPSYESRRKLVDVSSRDLHSRELRNLVESTATKTLQEQMVELWILYMQESSMPLTPVPTSLPAPVPTPITSPPVPAPTAMPVPVNIPTTVPAPTSSPVRTTGLPVKSPTGSPFKVPTQAPVKATTKSPTLVPVFIPTGSPVQGVTNAPVKEPTESPVQTFTQAPVRGPTIVPVPLATASPVKAPTQTPVKAPTVSPVEALTQAPVEAPTGSPVEALTQAPVEVPTGLPVRAPTQSPVKAPTGSPVKAPTQSPVKAPTGSPIKAPTQSPVKAPTGSPVMVPTQVPSPVPVSVPVPVPTNNRVSDIIRGVALFGGTEFTDPGSYQSKALAWLENSSTDSFSDKQIIQRYSLACIYYATNNVSTTFTDIAFGTGLVFPWVRSRDWLTDNDECTWANIACDGNNTVQILDLYSNIVTGEFPPEVVYLKDSLQVMDLGTNPVFTRGEMFNSYLGQLTMLEDLRYDKTNFINDKGVPTEIGLLKNLEYYTCANVRYVGALEPAVFQSDLTKLQYMEIEYNGYNSTIPTEVGNLPALQFFYVRESYISGDLSFMRNMPAIQEAWVDSNPGLAGPLPTFVGSLSTLRSWSVTACSFTGQMPTELGLLSDSVVQLFFYDNDLGGTVPDEWGNINTLTRLELQMNQISGTIPQSLCVKKFAGSLTLNADCALCVPTNCCSFCT